MQSKRRKINWSNKQDHLVQRITIAQRQAARLSHTDVAHELSVLKTRVQRARLEPRHHTSFLKAEQATFAALQRELSSRMKRKERRAVLLFFLTTLPTCSLYIGVYFARIPKHAYQANQPLYLTACGIILCAWILWFLLTKSIYRYLCTEYLFPYMIKHPEQARQASFAANSFYIFATMNPLFQAAFFAGNVITPSWSGSVLNLWAVMVGLFSGNFFTAIANGITFASVLLVGLDRIRKRARRRRYAAPVS